MTIMLSIAAVVVASEAALIYRISKEDGPDIENR